MGYGTETGRALAAAALRPGATRETMDAELQAFAAPRSAAPRSVTDAIEALQPALVEASGDPLKLVAITAGALVEGGADPGRAAEVLIDRMVREAASARPIVDAAAQAVGPDADDDQVAEATQRVLRTMPEAALAWTTLDLLLAPSIAMLSASAAARRRAVDALPDLDRLADAHEAAFWLRRAGRILYDEPFTAVEVATGIGIRGRMSGISDNFQLNVLLMDAFPQVGMFSRRRVSKAAAAVARGDGPQEIEETVTGVWDLLGWRGASLDGPPASMSAAWHSIAIWNEGLPADIPVLDGSRVIVLVPPSYKRVWGASREFPQRAGLGTIERLSNAEVRGLRERITAAARDQG